MVNAKRSILSRIFRREDVTRGVTKGERGAEPWEERAGTRRGNGTRAAPAVRRPVADVDEEVIEAPQSKGSPLATQADGVASKKVAEASQILASNMSRQEEMNLAVKQGFDGLNNVLDGIDRKIDKHQKTSDEIMISVRKLPEIITGSPDSSHAGLELLSRISAVLENQGRTNQELLNQVSQLPRTLESLQSQLGEQVAEITRGHKNVDRTMHETQRQLSNAFAEVQRTVGQVANDQGKKQEQVISEMRVQQARQDKRVEELLGRSNGAMRLVVFLLVVSIAALLLIANQISR